MNKSSENISYSLLPNEKTFAQLILPFALPYFSYVAIGSIPPTLFSHFQNLTSSSSNSLFSSSLFTFWANPLSIIRLFQFLAVAFLLWAYRKNYRFGPTFTLKQISISVFGGILATFLWIFLLRIFTPDIQNLAGVQNVTFNFQFSDKLFSKNTLPALDSPWILRAINSTFLVPIFEELFCRIFLLEFFHGLSWPFKNISDRIDQYPKFLSLPPLSWISVLAASTCFILGHSLSAWPAAFIYFVFTCWIYKLTLSFKSCILMHAIANGTIALLVLLFPSMRYLW